MRGIVKQLRQSLLKPILGGKLAFRKGLVAAANLSMKWVELFGRDHRVL